MLSSFQTVTWRVLYSKDKERANNSSRLEARLRGVRAIQVLLTRNETKSEDKKENAESCCRQWVVVMISLKDSGRWRGGLNKVLYGEAPPRGPNPYHFIYLF